LHALLVAAAIAIAQTPEEKQAVDQRLVHKVDFAAKLSIEEGDTLFIEKTEKIPAKRIAKKLADYEAIVTGVTAPKGIVVHDRIDDVKLEPAGDKITITFRYVVHADPGASGGGHVQLALKLIERTGLGNVVAEAKVKQTLHIVAPKSQLADLQQDFKGYRLYNALAKEKMDLLQTKAGIKLSLVDQGKLPALDRVGPETATTVFEFNRFRTRVWVAHRHLVQARASKDDKIAGAAKAYLSNLDKPESDLSGLPEGAAVAKAETKPQAIETLKPERVEEVGGPKTGQKGAGDKASSSITPLSSYEPGSESEEDEPTEPTRPKTEEKPKGKEGPKQPVAPGQKGETKVAQAGDEPAQPGLRKASVLGGAELLEERELSKEIPIPLYSRALVLDDPNIAYAAGVRFQWASVKGIHSTSGIAPAFFYEGQAAITRNLGVELSVPTAFVSLDVQRAQATYVMGNPLLSAKYRFHLPEVNGRAPVLTVRARWAIPLQPLHAVPPTQLGAEEFSQPAHFDDLTAFLLEKSAFGAGVNAAWQTNIVYLGFQLYSDYYFPVSGANDQTSFLTMSYGASVGVLPFGDLVGFFLEGRAASLFAGPRRTEFFTYLGARGHFADFVEPAAWIAIPIGDVHDVSSFQFGGGLRFSYDIQDAIVLSKGSSRDRSQVD
jgi:hypothetical protein